MLGDASMPTIHRFANCKIAIYADGHMPPHFHIEVAVFAPSSRLTPCACARAMHGTLRRRSHGPEKTSTCCAANGIA